MNTRRFSLKVVLAAVAMCAFALTASAAVYFNWDNRLADYLQPSEAQKEKLSTAGLMVGKSTTVNSLTFEVKQTLGDKYGAYILCDVTAPEGTALTDEMTFERIDLSLTGAKSLGYGTTILKDDDPLDNKRSYLLDLSSENGVQGKTVTLSLENLGYNTASTADNEEPEFHTLLAGKWEVTWEFDYTDLSRTIAVNKPIRILNGTSLLKSINISPLSVTVSIEGESIKDYGAQPPSVSEQTHPFYWGLVKITLKDETILLSVHQELRKFAWSGPVSLTYLAGGTVHEAEASNKEEKISDQR
jgi:hypothetical protein